jgi:hypothetical protein
MSITESETGTICGSSSRRRAVTRTRSTAFEMFASTGATCGPSEGVAVAADVSAATAALPSRNRVQALKILRTFAPLGRNEVGAARQRAVQ